MKRGQTMAKQEVSHSPQFERVKKWYDLDKWSAAVVRLAVGKSWITQEECDEILGENQ